MSWIMESLRAVRTEGLRALVGASSVEAAAASRANTLLAKATHGIPDWMPSGLLPEGVHQASIGEVATRLGFNSRRVFLLEQVGRAMTMLEQAGVKKVGIGGSMASAKHAPSDVDLLFLASGSRTRVARQAVDQIEGTMAIDGLQMDAVIRGGTHTWAGENKLELALTTREGLARGVVVMDLRPGDGQRLLDALKAQRTPTSS